MKIQPPPKGAFPFEVRRFFLGWTTNWVTFRRGRIELVSTTSIWTTDHYATGSSDHSVDQWLQPGFSNHSPHTFQVVLCHLCSRFSSSRCFHRAFCQVSFLCLSSCERSRLAAGITPSWRFQRSPWEPWEFWETHLDPESFSARGGGQGFTCQG